MADNSKLLTRKDIILLVISLFGTLVGTIVGAIIVGEGRFDKFNPTTLQWVILIVAITAFILLIILLITRWQGVIIGIKTCHRWFIDNWKITIGITLLIITILCLFVLTKSLWSIMLAVGLVIANFLITNALLENYQVKCLVIISALYGANNTYTDVTRLLKAKLKSGRLSLHVHNANLGGDPQKGIEKTLKVEYFYAGSIHVKNVAEGERLNLP